MHFCVARQPSPWNCSLVPCVFLELLGHEVGFAERIWDFTVSNEAASVAQPLVIFYVGDQDEVLTSTNMRKRKASSHSETLNTRRASFRCAQETAGHIGNTSRQLQVSDEIAAYFTSFERPQCRDPIWRNRHASLFSIVKPHFHSGAFGAESPFQRPSKASERSSGQHRFCRRAFRFVPSDRIA